jgi:hypothetical protein
VKAKNNVFTNRKRRCLFTSTYKILSAFRTAEGNTIRYTGSWGVTRVIIFHYAEFDGTGIGGTGIGGTGFVDTGIGTMGAWYCLSTLQLCIKVKGVMGGWVGILWHVLNRRIGMNHLIVGTWWHVGKRSHIGNCIYNINK